MRRMSTWTLTWTRNGRENLAESGAVTKSEKVGETVTEEMDNQSQIG